MVLLDMASETYIGLDAIGSRIWQLLHGGASVGDQLDTLQAEHEVELETLESGVGDLLESLSSAGLISN